MSNVVFPVSVEVPTDDQGSAALRDAVQLATQALARLQQDMLHQMQEAVRQQTQETLRQQEQRMEEALLQQEERLRETARQQIQEAEERLRREEERIRETARKQGQDAEKRLRQRETALDRREKRIMDVLERKPASLPPQRELRKRKRNAPCAVESGSEDGALRLLEGRIAKLEEGVGRALEKVFPRVEVLVAHLEATARPQGASPSHSNTTSDSSVISFVEGPSTSAAGRPSSAPGSLGPGFRLHFSISSEESSDSDSPSPDTRRLPMDPLPNTPYTSGYRLVEAARDGRLLYLRTLLDAGVDPNFFGGGRTPLMWASYNSREDLVTLLLQRGADVHAMIGGESALHLAASRDRTGQCVALLLRAGAVVNKRGKDGWTPLHFAAANCNVNAVQLLLDAGAFKTIRNKFGKAPFELACSEAIRDLLRL